MGTVVLVGARRWGIGRVDLLLTAALLVLPVAAVLALPPHWLDDRQLDALGVTLLVLATLPVLVRRRYPIQGLLFCLAVQMVYHALNYTHEVMLPVGVVLIYTVSLTTSRASTLAMVGLSVAGVLVSASVPQDESIGAEVISPLGWFAVAAVGGQAMRLHRALLTETSERRVAEERLRIARDLHDVLAHHIVVINSHAGVAAHLLDERTDDPSLAPISQSLHTVADASSGVLAELRTTLDVLRGNEVDVDRHPTPDLAGLARLVAVTTAVGVQVELRISGTSRPLPAAVEIALYRIAQEALTNVVKHAHARQALVQLEYDAEQIRLEVTDDGRGRSDSGSTAGYGIAGMSERAQSVGGQLVTGDGRYGGFRVAATVPTPGAR
jgi:signal transduction histidine kinase